MNGLPFLSRRGGCEGSSEVGADLIKTAPETGKSDAVPGGSSNINLDQAGTGTC